jgi:3'-phosphoadenosine 5'-phosphosulfate sulfotransferase (PAPS reductase)/FAD synthetase
VIQPYELKQRQSLPLEAKVRFTEVKARQFINECGKDTCVQVSGLDSAVLLDILRTIRPDIPAIFVDTGLEDPSVVEHARGTTNMTILKPDVSFDQVIKEHGYPAISKDVARALSDIQNPTARNEATRSLRLTGIKRDGTRGKSGSYLPQKYHRLIECGFRFSDKCCYFLKHKPAEKIHKEMNLAPFIGTLAEDSEKRARAYLKTGCNNFTGKMVSKPMSIWTRQDIYEYVAIRNLKIPGCYGRIRFQDDGKLGPTGEKHTGCQFCLFGILFDLLRIERLKQVHPARYRYCMENLNYKELLPLLLGVANFDEYLQVAENRRAK